MSPSSAKCALPLLIFTDLDGTLLDSDSYSFAAARSALDRVRGLGIPLIPTTSKTLAEMRALNERLANSHPCIVENGGAICVPEGYFDLPGDYVLQDGYRVSVQPPAYADLLAVLAGLRRERGLRFRGFGDMSDAEVAADTGLSLAEAGRARNRLCSEPLIWQDGEEALMRFRAELETRDLALTRGGRYWHVMGLRGKADAMAGVGRLYREAGLDRPITLALGDSPNDRGMLEAADMAVVIPAKDGRAMTLDGAAHARIGDAPGPEGWGRMVHRVLDDLTNDPASLRAAGEYRV